jgi:hypothetical protein
MAIIGTDTVTFVQFSIQGRTTGNNVGTGVGKVFKDKVGILMNFKTFTEGQFLDITNGSNELTFAVTATSDNTINTLVARDSAGNFSAGTITATLAGGASANVLKAGDTMTGTLSMTTENAIRWYDSTAGNFVGFKAPSAVSPASYTVSWPSAAPLAGQTLYASSPTETAWRAVDAPPAVNKMYFVSLAGNDTTNDGSLSAPFSSIKKALFEANAIASSTNPVAINVDAGIFVEDNSGGPLEINASGISIVGDSLLSTIITPSSAADTLFTITANILELSNFTLQAPAGSSASAITLIANMPGRYCFKDILTTSFATGFDISATAPNLSCIFLDNARFINNDICVENDNAIVSITNSYIRGSSTDTPDKIGVSSTGSNASTNIFNSIISTCTTGVTITGGATGSLLSCEFENTEQSVVCSGGSKTEITGCSFLKNTPITVNIASSGANTTVTAEGCNFYCSESPADPRGTVFKVTNAGEIVATSHVVRNATLGIECGQSGDTDSTIMKAGSIYLISCTQDIQQTGTSILRFISGIFDANKVSVENPTNVSISSFDRPGNTGNITMAIGNSKDVSQRIYEIVNDGPANRPCLSYEPNYYGAKGTVYKNPGSTPTCNATQALGNNAYSYVITSSRDKEACIKLVSDTSSTMGDWNNVRGWEIKKLANSADLAFSFTNNDSSGLAISGPNTIMQLDGNNNQVLFPLAANAPVGTTAQLVWGSDTNLYRSTANTLKTDDNLVVAGATVLTTLTINAGTAAQPSLQFAGNTNTGFSAATANRLSCDINGSEKLAINATTVTATTTLIAAAACLLQKQVCLGGIQVDSTSGTSVTVADDTSVLLKTASVANYAVTMPANPINGQLLTIMVSGNFNMGLTYPGATIYYAVDTLRPQTNPDANSNGQSVTYMYHADTATWYRYSRG